MSLADDEALRVSNLLKTLSNVPNPQIEEHVFIRKWFNIIFGRRHTEEDVIPIQKWVDEVSGTPHNSVDVMRNGEVIFTIPPILDSSQVVLEKSIDLQSMLARYRNEKNVSERNGQNFFEAVIAGSFKEVLADPNTPHEYKKQLYAIAQQYGLRAPDGPTASDSGDSANVEYEDAF